MDDSDIAHPLACPLCQVLGATCFYRDVRREYFRCGVCRLVFVPSKYFITAEEEKACYDLHQNDPADARYRRFLARLADPLIERLPIGARGLDFGSGPGPTLSVMLAEAGFPTEIYDPIYAPIAEVWSREYDFITASEVVEHLHDPVRDLQRVWNVLKPGGWLGIMTKRVIDATAFAQWHYKQDPTHVAFFAEETFTWLAAHWSTKCEVVGPDIVLMQKPFSHLRPPAR